MPNCPMILPSESSSWSILCSQRVVRRRLLSPTCESRGVAGVVRLMVIVAAPQGVEAVLASDPDVEIYACAIDERLDENAYILPGLGDAGDRIFGTE